MEELENLLLEAAGRTNTPGKNRRSHPPSRSQREGSYYDDGSDSNDDDYESGDQRGGSSDESDVGSDLYKDNSDREQLAQLTELQREMILSERAQRRDEQRLTKRVRGKQSGGNKTQPGKETPCPPSSRVRSSVRSAEQASAKDGALNELRAKRLKQQNPESHYKSVRPQSNLTAIQSSYSNQNESQSGSDDGDKELAEGEDLAESDIISLVDHEALTFEDIKNITIPRSRLAKWVMEPFFEELIVGCFVRVGIGMNKTKNKNVYRLCMVRNVDATDPDRQYKLENKSTHKYLNIFWASESSAARWQMARASDSPPLEEEFDELVHEVKKIGGQMPSRHDMLEKWEAIQKTDTYVYSAATMKQMLQEKKLASLRPLNIAAEKDRLRRELEVAKRRSGNRAEMGRIQARLRELEATSREPKIKDAKALRLEEMNKRNKIENFKNASELKPVNTSLKAGEAGYDPFSRRWTRSRNYYVSNPGGGDEATISANEDAATSSIGPGGMATTTAALEAAAGAGKLVDTRVPVDVGTASNSLHHFELTISFAELQKNGGPGGAHLGLLARKQRIEATVGCKVAENNRRRHSLTLTVGDYKRRRGLL